MRGARASSIAALLSVVGATVGAAREETPLPEGNAYVRGILAGPRPQDTAINDYSYDVEEVRENLDASGHPTSRETRGYEVYFVQTRPVKRLVSRDGTPLSAKEQAEVDRRAEAQARAIAEGRTVSEQPGIRLKTLLDSFDFKTAGREMRAGRKTLVFNFEPRKGAQHPSSDRAAGAIARILAGRLHIDEEDRRVAVLDARSAPGEKASVSTGVKVAAFELRMDYTAVDEHAWLPRRVAILTVGRAFVFKTFRIRRTTTYSNYRRFRVTTDERPIG